MIVQIDPHLSRRFEVINSKCQLISSKVHVIVVPTIGGILIRIICICVLLSTTGFGQSKWEPLGLDGGGSMYSIAGSPHDPKTVMISSDMSGAFISRDRGRSWTMIHHKFVRGNSRCQPLFDPENAKRIYFPKASGSATLCKSDDGGVTWAEVRKTPWREAIVYVGKVKGVLFVGTVSAVYALPTGDGNWVRWKGVEGSCFSVCFNHGKMIIGTDRGVYRAVGKTYQKITDGREMARLTGFSGNAKNLYVTVPSLLVSGQLVGGIYHSANGGSTWKRIITADLNLKTKRSSKWANSDLPQYRWPMTSDANPNRVYVYCSGTSYYPPNHSTIYRSDNAGKSWRAIWFSDPRFKKSYNVENDRLTAGVGQRYQYPPVDLSMNPANPDILMMSTDMMGFFTYDGGKSWHVSQDPKPVVTGKYVTSKMGGLGVTTTWRYVIDPHNSDLHYICYTDIGMARSKDAGKTWSWDGPRLPWKNTTYDLIADPDRAGRLWGAFSVTHDIPNYNVIGGKHKVRMDGGVAVSNDYGDSWKRLSTPKAPCLSIVMDPRSPINKRRLYASLFQLGVYVSGDGGKTWKPLASQPGTPGNRRVCRLVLHKDGTLFCLVTAKRVMETYDGLGPGLYHSKDNGASWIKTTKSLPLHWPKDFDVNPNDSKDVLIGASNVRGHKEAGLYRTQDGGDEWARIAQFESEHFGGYFHPKKEGWIYATCTEGAKNCGLYLSQDDGQTWKPFTTLPFSNIHRVHFDAHHPDKIILSTFGASVLRGPAIPEK